jgi:hypothetical protein
MHHWFHAQGLNPQKEAAAAAAQLAAAQRAAAAAAQPLPQPQPQPQPQPLQYNALPRLAASVAVPAMPAVPAVPAPVAARLHSPSSAEVLSASGCGGVLLVCDFDKTLTDCDAGERLCDELAPELTSLLSQVEMPANFIPVTNTVLSGECVECSRV